jgi:ankyrin repeat protein|eukprot:COSAG02_NODE_5968_length_3902_cov_5.539574_4_plen_279_part_00
MWTTDVFAAAASGSIEEMQQLLLAHAGDGQPSKSQLRVVDEAGRTLLYSACMHGNVAVARFLVDRGWADVAQPSQLGMTPVCAAACQGHLSAVRFLCEGPSSDEVDIEIGDRYGARPVFLACMSGHEDVVRYLVEEQRADIVSCTNEGQTCFFTACDHGKLQIVHYLAGLLSPKDIAAVTKRGWSPLIAAACRGHDGVVEFLLDEQQLRDMGVATADPAATTCDDETAFFGAAFYGHYIVARRLATLALHTVFTANIDDQTPLYAAARRTLLGLCIRA